MGQSDTERALINLGEDRQDHGSGHLKAETPANDRWKKKYAFLSVDETQRRKAPGTPAR